MQGTAISCRIRRMPSVRLLLILLPGLIPLRAAEPGSPPRQVQGPPHIVIILADDMGYSDIGCYGGEVKTPHLDKMAGEGLRFTQFYNTGRCCPTRAALLTGLYPHQAGIGHMVGPGKQPGKQPGYLGHLNDRSVTIAEVLRAAGYRTGAFGKWHVTPFDYVSEEAPHRDSWPLQRGFDRFVGSLAGGGNFYGPKGWMEDNEFKEPGEGFYYTDAVSEAAVEFIEKSGKDKPLFLYVAYTAPHWPLHAHQKDIAKYQGAYDVGWDAIRQKRYERMREMGLIKPEWKLSPRDGRVPAWEVEPDKAWRAHQMATYAAMIDCMDQGIGRIRQALAQTGRGEDTLILFLSDNGGCEEDVGQWSWIKRFAKEGQDTSNWGNLKEVMAGPPGTFQSYGIPWANASNTPLRWYKSEVHEGGISTPLVVHWPRGIAAQRGGSFVHEPGHVIDLMATAVDVAGAAYPRQFGEREVQPMEGVSLKPAMHGSVLTRSRPLFFAHEGNRAVRDGNWKLVKLRKGSWELYDLEKDRSELNDLAAQEPERVKEMAMSWQAWAERAGVVPGPFDR